MKEGWEKKKLGEVAAFQRGLTYSSEDEVDFSSKCVLRSNNIDLSSHTLIFQELKYLREDFEFPKDKLLKKDSIFICMSNGSKQHIGKVAYVDKDYSYAFGGFMGLIVPKETIDAKFIYYFCISSSFKSFLEGIGKGANIKNLRFTELGECVIPVPPLSVQESIVSELDMLSGIISKHKALQEEYDRLEQSIFYDMFGDPVTNEKGWEVKKLGDECTEVKYGTSRPASEDGQYKYLRMGNLTQNGFLDLTDVKTIDIPDDEIEKCIVRKGDVLFNRTNSLELIGKTCLFDLDEPMVIAGYIIRVRLTERINPRYLVSMFNLPSIKTLLKSMAKGAVNQANINSQELKSIKVPLPPIENQNEYEKKFDFIEQMKAKNKAAQEEAEMLFNERMAYYF